MVAFEYLRIVEKDGALFYIAQPNGRPPTEFKLTSATPNKAIFENAQHDHPKIITYEKDAAGNVVATVEGESAASPENRNSASNPPLNSRPAPLRGHYEGRVAPVVVSPTLQHP